MTYWTKLVDYTTPEIGRYWVEYIDSLHDERRAKGQITLEVPTMAEMERRRREFVENGIYVQRGSYSLWIPAHKTHIVHADYYPITPSAAARRWIRDNSTNHTPQVWPTGGGWTSPPIYGNSENIQMLTGTNCTYLDLRGAYWNVWRYMSYGMRYNRMTGAVAQRGGAHWYNADKLAPVKQPRNAAYGIMCSFENTTYVARYLRGAPGFAPHVAQYVLDVIGAVAADVCTRYDVAQWLTDACIVPTEQAAAVTAYVRDAWRMEVVPKYRGICDLHSAPYYSFGDGHEVKHWARRTGRAHGTAPRYVPAPPVIDRLRRDRARWMRNTHNN